MGNHRELQLLTAYQLALGLRVKELSSHGVEFTLVKLLHLALLSNVLSQALQELQFRIQLLSANESQQLQVEQGCVHHAAARMLVIGRHLL